MGESVKTGAPAAPFSPTTTPRWHEYATEGRVFCGPRPGGHHIPNTYDIPEHGFIRCSARIRLSPELDEVQRLRSRGDFVQADRLTLQLRAVGVEVPDAETMRTMSQATEPRECGRWVFLYAVRGGKVVVAEVSLDEKTAMRRLATPAEMIEYLGIFKR